jgi:hypothetical protein
MPCQHGVRDNIDIVGECYVPAMFPSELPRITLYGVVQASLDASPTGRGRQSGEFANSINIRVTTRKIAMG